MKVSFKLDAQLARRSLFVLGNFATLGLAIWVIVVPIDKMFAERETRMEDQRLLLGRLRAIAAQASAVEALSAETELQFQSGEFLTGASDNVISADLQTKLKTILGSSGAQSRAIQSLPSRTVDRIRYCGVRVDLSGPLPSVMHVVHAVESAKPYLFIFSATLKSGPALRQGAAEEPMLQAQLDVYGAIQ